MARRLLESGGVRLIESGAYRLLEPIDTTTPDPDPIMLSFREHDTATRTEHGYASGRENFTTSAGEFGFVTNRERFHLTTKERP